MNVRTAVVGLMLGGSAALAGATACASAGPAQGSSAPTAAQSAAPATAATGSPDGTRVTGVVVRACRGQDLAVGSAGRGVAGGHGGLVLLFTNRGSAPCTLRAYPGMDALDGSGRVLAHAQRTPRGFIGGLPPGVTRPPTLTVLRGQTVSALSEWDNIQGGGGCPSVSARIAVTPPNTTTTSTLPDQVPTCNLQIHPVVAGTTGSAS